MFVEVDQETGLSDRGHASQGHQTIADIKAQGCAVIHAKRGVMCTEIHHTRAFSVVWEKLGKASAADRVDSAYLGVVSNYRYVFGSCILDDTDRIEFDVVFDEDLAQRRYRPAKRRSWNVQTKLFDGDFESSFRLAVGSDVQTPEKV